MKLFLTFDYELFFNDTNYKEYDVLIEPTERLSLYLEKYGARGTFFVDMSSIMRYLELGSKEYPQLAKEQIHSLYGRGHSIELHTHPHWYNSYCKNGKWEFDNSYYCLNSYSDEEIEGILSKEKQCLEKTMKEKYLEYKCTVFRAGGFCIQPYERIGRVLSQIGIEIDSSICSGAYEKNGIHDYDFRKSPRKFHYTWGGELGVQDANVSCLQEIPIATIEHKVFKVKIWKFSPKLNPGQLKGKHTPNNKNKKGLAKQLNRIHEAWRQPLILGFDTLHHDSMLAAVEYIEKKSRKQGVEPLVVLIAHPKFQTEITIRNLEEFLKSVTINHKDWKFCTLGQGER